MLYKTLFLALIAAAIFTFGCHQEPTTTQQLDAAKADTKAAAQDMKDYTFAQKDEFIKQMQVQLAALNQELDQLAAKIEKSSDAAKAEAKPKLEALRNQVAGLNKQLDEVKSSTESTWDSVKAGTRKAYDAVKEGFNQSRQWVSDKIAP